MKTVIIMQSSGATCVSQMYEKRAWSREENPGLWKIQVVMVDSLVCDNLTTKPVPANWPFCSVILTFSHAVLS